jgi:intracellular sulfur oxidation DsrE/DsrF family protein
MRRTVLKTLLAALPITAVAALGSRVAHAADAVDTGTAAAGAGSDVRVVYHFADGLGQAARGLANIRNHLRAEPGVQIVVVALADGISFLLHDAVDAKGRPFAEQVEALAARGVVFRVCGNTLAAHQVPLARVLPQASVVPSGVAELARLQARQQFVYIRP